MAFNNKTLKGKAAIVTGAGRGIGKAAAMLFAKKGCNLVICSRTESELRLAKKEAEMHKVMCIAIKADISKPKDILKVVKAAKTSFCRINFLINNAGICHRKALQETAFAQIDSTIAINLKGLICMSKEAMPILDNGYARIINVSSGLGKRGQANYSVYSATKFGVIGFTESIAQELPEGIRAYSICPKGTNTRMFRDNYPGRGSLFLDTPERVAKAILRACSKDFKLMSGASIEL